MSTQHCPFCPPDPARVFHEGRLILGLWDAFPVSSGHALLVTRRHVSGWLDATREERQELVEAIAVAHEAIRSRHMCDGFNFGVNVGAAAGQTVFHLHLHVIPRTRGDVADPRGGIRGVIPGKGAYEAREP